jgi:hypothetical protein
MNNGSIVVQMKILSGLIAAVVVSGVLVSSTLGQTAGQDPKAFIQARPLGADIRVQTVAPQKKVYKGSLVSRDADSIVLQPRKPTVFSHLPPTITVAYADIDQARLYDPQTPIHALFTTYAVVAIALSAVVAVLIVLEIIAIAHGHGGSL